MFNLEQSIAQWRRQMLAAGIKSAMTLDELESHLRDDIGKFVSTGEPIDRAFDKAVARLGEPHSVHTEFNKIKRPWLDPVKIACVLWFAMVIAMAIFFSKKLFAGTLHFFTYAHILAVTAGYGAVFLIGSFGIYEVCLTRLRKLSAVHGKSLRQAIHLFSWIAAGLLVAGIIFGMFVSKKLFGRYWSWDPKEIGALCVLAWAIALATMQRLGQISDRVMMAMCIGGNILFSLAWFGAGIFDYHMAHSNYSPNYWPLAVFLGLNICFLTMALLPNHLEREPEFS